MTKQEQNQQLRAVRLLLEYYTYFLNLDTIKGAYVEAKTTYTPGRWDSVTGNYIGSTVIYDGVRIAVRNYKTRQRREEATKLKTLLTLCPDMHCQEDTTRSSLTWQFYDVTWINYDLTSISNNALGLERKDVE